MLNGLNLIRFSAALLALSLLLPWQAHAETEAELSKQASLTGSFLASHYARSSGDIDGAIHFLRRVHRNQPDDAEISAQLISLMLLDGQVREATQIAAGLPETGGKDPLVLLVQLLQSVKNNKMDEASRRVDDAFEIGVGQLWLPLISSWIEVVRRPPDEPVVIQQLSGNLSRAVPILHYHLALINEYAGFTEAAATNFKDALENPKNPPPRVMEQMIRFYSHHGSPPLLAPLVKDYLALYPEMASAANAPKPTMMDGVAEVLFSMGSVMRSAGITHDALAYLQLSLYLKPDNASALMSLGDAYSDVRLYERANRLGYAKIREQERLYSDAQVRAAINLERMGDLPGALRQLDKLVEHGAGTRSAMIARGDLLRRHHRYDEAIHAYTQVLNSLDALSKEDWALLFARAVSFERTQQWDDAENDLMKALVLAPDQPDVLNYLGYSWMVRGVKLDEASQMIEKALAARPNDPQIIDSMGWSLYLRGRYEDAARYMERAVSLLPSDPAVNDHLGDIYWRLGRKTEARFQWERSLSFNPEKAEAELILRKIEHGLDALSSAAAGKAVLMSEQAGSEGALR